MINEDYSYVMIGLNCVGFLYRAERNVRTKKVWVEMLAAWSLVFMSFMGVSTTNLLVESRFVCLWLEWLTA